MVNPIVVKALICAYAIKNHAKPAYVAAVAHVESRFGEMEFRTWKTGRYYQPMGIDEDFLYRRGWPVDTLDGNVDRGSQAFAGIDNLEDLKRRLQTYNSSFNSRYWSEIKKAVAKYENEFRG
jgi:hypothetical protein